MRFYFLTMEIKNLSYLSSPSLSIEGKIKQSLDSFIVEEIDLNGNIYEINKIIDVKNDEVKNYLHVVVKKENWATQDLAREFAKALGISKKRISWSGTKDKFAIATQVFSFYKVKKEDIKKIRIRNTEILGAWYAEKKINLGDLLGNRFTITIDREADNETVKKIVNELNYTFPNYFGPQRFGSSRKNTHKIGEAIVRGNLKEAVEIFLTDYEGEENIEAIEARKQLKEEGDYKRALKFFPKYLWLERLVIQHLAKNERDYANALRKLPRQILILFIHAFQAHLFNILLSERLKNKELKVEEGEYKCGERLGFPFIEDKNNGKWIVGKIIGYESILNEREKNLLEKFEIRKEDFKISQIPEIGSKGSYRTLLAPLKNFYFEKNTFRFELPSGSYATSALREFIKDLW